MSADWRDVWESAVAATEHTVRVGAPRASRYIRGILEGRRARIRLLMHAWADHALDESTLEHELKQERDIVAQELRAIRGMDLRVARRAASVMFRRLDAALVAGIVLASPEANA